MNKFIFESNNIKYEFDFVRVGQYHYLDIDVFFTDGSRHSGYREIKQNKIEWVGREHFFKFSTEAKTYIEKIVKLLVFI